MLSVLQSIFFEIFSYFFCMLDRQESSSSYRTENSLVRCSSTFCFSTLILYSHHFMLLLVQSLKYYTTFTTTFLLPSFQSSVALVNINVRMDV